MDDIKHDERVFRLWELKVKQVIMFVKTKHDPWHPNTAEKSDYELTDLQEFHILPDFGNSKLVFFVEFRITCKLLFLVCHLTKKNALFGYLTEENEYKA